jgi:hypothetical protein
MPWRKRKTLIWVEATGKTKKILAVFRKIIKDETELGRFSVDEIPWSASAARPNKFLSIEIWNALWEKYLHL